MIVYQHNGVVFVNGVFYEVRFKVFRTGAKGRTFHTIHALRYSEREDAITIADNVQQWLDGQQWSTTDSIEFVKKAFGVIGILIAVEGVYRVERSEEKVY